MLYILCCLECCHSFASLAFEPAIGVGNCADLEDQYAAFEQAMGVLYRLWLDSVLSGFCIWSSDRSSVQILVEPCNTPYVTSESEEWDGDE